MLTIQTLRKELRQAGYKMRVKTYTDFKAVIVMNADGDAMPSIFTTDTRPQWQKAIAIKAPYKGNLTDGFYNVVL